MDTVFLASAALGGTRMLLQFLAGLVGFGGDHDLSGDHDVGGDHDNPLPFLGMLSLRTGSAGLVFFGLTGLLAGARGVPPQWAVPLAVLGGFMAFYLLALLIRGMNRLADDGTVRVENAVGRDATVYVAVPAGGAGAGKVMMNLQNRTVELRAVTPGAALATGSAVTVTAVLGPDTVEVTPVLSGDAP